LSEIPSHLMTSKIFPKENPTRALNEFEYITGSETQGQRLGKGSFASVRLVREKRSGALLALKMNNTNISEATKSDLHNLKIEIQIHRELDHPNIIKFHDYFQEGMNVFLLLEYAPNGNLYEYINKKKPLPPNQIFRFFYQTCKAIQYLHQKDILHRDIKPENLLLDKDLNVKICDFGWAGRSIHERRTTFCGTYEYMAPELVQKKTYDYRVDIWSLGVLLYELLHGHSPYKGRSLSEIALSLSQHRVTFSPSISVELRNLIQRILQFDPNSRPTIEEILSSSWVQRELRALEGGLNASSQQPSMYQTNLDLLTSSSDNSKTAHKSLQFNAKKFEDPRILQASVQRDLPSGLSPHITRSQSQQFLLDSHPHQLTYQASVSEKEINVTSSRCFDEKALKDKAKTNISKIRLMSESQGLNCENTLGEERVKTNPVPGHLGLSSTKILSSRFVNTEAYFSVKNDITKLNDIAMNLASSKGYSHHKSPEIHKVLGTASTETFRQPENSTHLSQTNKPNYITNSNLISSTGGFVSPSTRSMENYSIMREFSKSPDASRPITYLKDRSINLTSPQHHQHTIYADVRRHEVSKPSAHGFTSYTPAPTMPSDRYHAAAAHSKRTYLENLRTHYGNLSHSYNQHHYETPKSALLYSNHTPQGMKHQSPISLKLIERSVSAYNSPMYMHESEQALNLDELKASVSRLNAKRQDYNKLYHGTSGLNQHLSL